MLYGAPVWINCISKQWCQKELKSVQRLIAIKIIRSFKTVSYETAITLAKLNPIVNRAEQRSLVYFAKHPIYLQPNQITPTTKSIVKLSNSYNVNLNDYQTSIPLHEMFQPDFNPDIAVYLNNEVQSHINNIVIYTDGSKSELGTGSSAVLCVEGVYRIASMAKLRSENSIYQAEALAIYMALCLIQRSQVIGPVQLFSDSKSVLASIKSYQNRDALINNIKHLYVILKQNGLTISFHWCKGHSGLIGNEIADKYAKEAVFTNLPRNHLSLPVSHLKQTVKTQGKNEWNQIWLKRGNNCSKFIPNPFDIKINFNCYQLTQLITGHNKLNFYLQNFGIIDSSLCSCGQGVEDYNHYLYDCSNFDQIRLSLKDICKNWLLLDWPPKPYELVQNPLLLFELKKYIINSKRLDYD
jgi:ribonuclease HI